jgi:hypothetical protein
MRNSGNRRRTYWALVLLALILFLVLRTVWWLPMLMVLVVWWTLKAGQLEQQRYVGTWLRSYIASGVIGTVLFGFIKVVTVALGWMPWPDRPGTWVRFGVDIGDDILAAAWLLATLCLWFVLQKRSLRRYEQEALQGQSRTEGIVLGIPIETKESGARDRKQFYVLLGTTAWIGLVALFMVYLLAQEYMPMDSPLLGLWRANPWFSFFALSIPGLAFGAVLFWWFRKER